MICFYGASSHGRELVDSMSLFGIKAIVTEDFYWSTSEEIVQSFNANNEKENRVYKEITEDAINSQKLPHKKSLKGNMKEHMIAFRKDGAIVQKHDICEFCLVGDNENCVYEYGNAGSNKDAMVVVEDGYGNGDHNDGDHNDDDNENNETVQHAIVSGNIIPLRMPMCSLTWCIQYILMSTFNQYMPLH